MTWPCASTHDLDAEWQLGIEATGLDLDRRGCAGPAATTCPSTCWSSPPAPTPAPCSAPSRARACTICAPSRTPSPCRDDLAGAEPGRGDRRRLHRPGGGGQRPPAGTRGHGRRGAARAAGAGHRRRDGRGASPTCIAATGWTCGSVSASTGWSGTGPGRRACGWLDGAVVPADVVVVGIGVAPDDRLVGPGPASTSPTASLCDERLRVLVRRAAPPGRRGGRRRGPLERIRATAQPCASSTGPTPPNRARRRRQTLLEGDARPRVRADPVLLVGPVRRQDPVRRRDPPGDEVR